jgi:hypothetical protein
MAKCAGIKRDGTACKGIPIDASGYCWAHHPENAQKLRAAGQKGGKHGGRGRPLTDVAEVKKRLSDLADDTLEGAVDTCVAAVVAQVLNVLLRAVTVELQVKEQQELEARLEELEAALGHNIRYEA